MLLQIGQIRSTIFARKVVVMKKIVCMLCALFLVAPVFADTYVNGYYRKDGTYVNGHYRSNADGNRYNNYSTRGNTNPYTGQQGYKNPYNNSYSNSYGNSYGNGYNNYGYGY
jgi:hypothetical protein